MKIYERDNFNGLPEWFWETFNEKNKKSIISSGYPIIPIRVMICDKDEMNESWKKFHDINHNQGNISGIFVTDFDYLDHHVVINLNTIEYYITDKLLDWDLKTPYEEWIETPYEKNQKT